MNLNQLKDLIEKNEMNGDYEKIIQILHNVLKDNKISRDIKEFAEIQIKELLYDLAQDYFTDLEYEKALDFSLKAKEFDENSQKLKKLIGNSYFELENYSECLEYYWNFLEKNPNDAEVLRNTGISLLEHGQLDKAKNILERAIKLDPNDSLTLAKLGGLGLELDNFKKAIDYYELSLEKSFNKHPIEWRNLGYAYLSYGLSLLISDDVDKITDILSRSKKYYDKAFEEEEKWPRSIDPDFDTWFVYGEINFYLGERDTAKKAFLKAKSIDPNLWEYFEGDWFFGMWKENDKIIQKIISNYNKGKKKKKRFVYYCKLCKKSYEHSESLQRTLDGKYLCPKHEIELEKYNDISLNE
ncbi:hypothetical protein LCGC14_0900680 [marine sediment metagenome]|uniref:Tetratricopeptide repeat protein n=1 Tax=marine sediment metagenome TaxID=412755 RepID=A0A0F9S3G1_9ZZZZ